MAPPFLHALRDLAAKDPAKLPASILLQSSSFSLTIFDLYPKAIFHFLILPRHTGGQTPSHLKDLQSLLASGKKNALKILQPLKEDALKARETIEEEMTRRYGVKWPINIGFHAVPSMDYLHLHVISDDLCATAMKTKKHFNSFHPKVGFFLHLDDVMSEWCENDYDSFKVMSKLRREPFERLLKEDMYCWRCDRTLKNMPETKAHMQDEHNKAVDTLRKRLKNKAKETSKRPRDDTSSSAEEAGDLPPTKRRETTGDSICPPAIAAGDQEKLDSSQ